MPDHTDTEPTTAPAAANGHHRGRHVCALPAEWTPRTTWRCPDGHLWTIDTACGTCWWLGRGEGGARHVCTPGLAWWPANWRQRLLAHLRTGPGLPMRQARLDMAGPNREAPTAACTPKPPPAPRTPGGVSSPDHGPRRDR
jgi:hypothetical protein